MVSIFPAWEGPGLVAWGCLGVGFGDPIFTLVLASCCTAAGYGMYIYTYIYAGFEAGDDAPDSNGLQRELPICT